jgi:threonine synthase
MESILGLRCTLCGAEYNVDEVPYVCPKHGTEGILDVVYDYARVARSLSPADPAKHGERSMWRYLPLLPVDAGKIECLVPGTVLASVGWTPLYPAPRLATGLGLCHLWVKDDGRQPTASLKDRASAVAIAKARELGYATVTTASTGNAAAALAGLCAGVGQRNVIFVPRTAPQAKIAQLLVYGAEVLLVEGTYDDAFNLCLEAAPAFEWYNRSTGYNPYMSEGKKTVAFELCEQLTALAGAPADAPWRAPDCVFVPVGDGCILGGMHKGLSDLLALGWIDHMPRLFGVQAAGSAPLVDAWECGLEGQDMAPVEASSIADSIVAGLPRDRIKALRAVRNSEGAFLRVTDDEILAAIPELARGCGVFAEPAAAAAYAGLCVAVAEKMIDLEQDEVVVLATGSGLKDVAAAISSVASPSVIAPQLDAVREAIER